VSEGNRDRLFAANVMGTWLAACAFTPQIREAERGPMVAGELVWPGLIGKSLPEAIFAAVGDVAARSAASAEWRRC